MKPRTIFWGLRGLWVLLLLGACGREEIERSEDLNRQGNDFFVLSAMVDPQLKVMIDSLVMFDRKTPFVIPVTLRYGVPKWDKAINTRRGKTLVSIVPLHKPDEMEISGFIALEMGSRLEWKIYDAKKPERYGYRSKPGEVNAKTVNDLARALNFKAFGRQGGSIDDPCLMTNREAALVRNARRVSPGKDIQLYAHVVEITTCYSWETCMGDGNGNCMGSKTLHTECITEYAWTNGSTNDFITEGPDYGGVPLDDGNGPGSNGYSGAVNNYSCGNEDLDQLAYVEGPDKPINDISKYVECFSGALPAKITFYADQPVSGSREVFSMKEKNGHAFISIEQNINGKIVRRSLGFYPKHLIDPFYGTSGPSQLGDNSWDIYDVKLEVAINATQTQNVLQFIKDAPDNYNLQKYNCTHFVLDISDIIGLKMPRTIGDWVIGKGLNPGNFGEDLRNQTGAIVETSISPSNLGNCD